MLSAASEAKTIRWVPFSCKLLYMDVPVLVDQEWLAYIGCRLENLPSPIDYRDWWQETANTVLSALLDDDDDGGGGYKNPVCSIYP